MSPRAAQLRKIDPSAPSDKFAKDCHHLPNVAMLTQLRTGHIPLNQYLYKIRKSPTAVCPACRK